MSHKFHQNNHKECEECRGEEKTRVITHEMMLKKYPALKNPNGSNYPTGYRPE